MTEQMIKDLLHLIESKGLSYEIRTHKHGASAHLRPEVKRANLFLYTNKGNDTIMPNPSELQRELEEKEQELEDRAIRNHAAGKKAVVTK